jgi:hypothetical protein
VKPVNRRHFLKSLAAAPIGFVGLLPNGAKGMDCEVQHPIMPPNSQYEGSVPGLWDGSFHVGTYMDYF